MADAPSISFVCCVESGPLEDQAVRLAMSLRRFGGRFSSCPLLAVRARPGPELSSETLAAFDRAEVRYASISALPGLAWNKFLNKPRALEWAAGEMSTSLMCWLDSDILVTGEPEAFELAPGIGFAACAPDKNLGSAGPEDPNEPYWVAVCEALGIDIAALPVVTALAEGIPIRLYFNSGVFVFERDGPMARTFLRTCLDLAEARIASRHAGIFFLDQVALGLAAFRSGVAFSELPLSHNHTLGSKAPPALARAENVAGARILHYHDALWPPNWPGLVRLLGEALPEVRGWLEPLGPMRNPAGTLARLHGKALAFFRGMRQREYEEGCRHA
jgi:hypothetical protein